MKDKMTRLAIVVPCYNEREVLPEACARLTALLERLHRAGKITADSRAYLVDDGSTDTTWSLIAGFVSAGLPVVGIKLSRNRGHQNAVLAGLFCAAGDAVVSVDADLQDDLEAIEKMLDRLVLHASDEGRLVYERLGFIQTNEMRFRDRPDQLE